MPMATSPLSLTSEMTDGNFVPQFPNSLAHLQLTNFHLVEQQGVKLHFVEDEAVGPPISEANASYVEDCCKKRILSSELAKFKEAFRRPENCPALSVPTINPNLWAQFPKESKEHDKRLQNAQSLLAKGLTGVVQIKKTSPFQLSPRSVLFTISKALVGDCFPRVLLSPKGSSKAGD